jgi:hypothetical protein
MTTLSSRPVFFGFEQESAEFRASFVQAIHEINRRLVHNRIPEENTQHFTHGRTWIHTANQEIGTGEMQAMSAEMDVKFSDIIDNNLDLVPKALTKVVETLQEQFTKALYEMVTQACDRSGNVVSAKTEGSFAAGFMEAIRKIEFGVDRKGHISLPEIHTGQDPQKLIAELEAQPPDFRAEIERIKSEKIAEALERERLRKGRFKR